MFFVPGAMLLQENFPRGRAFDYLKKIPRGVCRGGCSCLELIDASLLRFELSASISWEGKMVSV